MSGTWRVCIWSHFAGSKASWHVRDRGGSILLVWGDKFFGHTFISQAVQIFTFWFESLTKSIVSQYLFWTMVLICCHWQHLQLSRLIGSWWECDVMLMVPIDLKIYNCLRIFHLAKTLKKPENILYVVYQPMSWYTRDLQNRVIYHQWYTTNIDNKKPS